MIYTIQTDELTVRINDKGAELWSIKTPDGTEYLWQGDPKYWPDRALNLFPQVGLCTDGCYELDGKRYPMDIHGFIKDTVLHVEDAAPDRITFWCEDTADTLRVYPFRFRYELRYRLSGSKLHICIRVENREDKEMHFSVGGHLGFNVPLEQGLSYGDYCLQFPAGASARRVACTPGPCQAADGIADYPLPDGKIPLSHALFADRVIILQDMPRTVTLCAARGKKQVTVDFPDMKYLGLWKWVGTDAPYLCIEPWSGLPARAGVVEDYGKHPDFIHLAPHAAYENNWSIYIQ